MSAFAIETVDLTKRYGQKTVVSDLNLQVAKGSCLAFLGPNGAGKSTTVNMIIGLTRPSGGRVLLNGRPFDGRDAAAKACFGVLPENFLLFDHLSLWEHFLMLGPVYGLSVPETGKRAGEFLEYLDLEGERRTPAAEASYGMKKKLCLGLALVHNPGILILDEPFEGLDPLASLKVQNLIGSLRAKGKTVFLCSHVLGIVEELADDFAILARGLLVFHESRERVVSGDKSLRDIFLEKAFPGSVPAGADGGGLAWLD